MSTGFYAPQSEDSSPPITLRQAASADAEACGKICYEAFRDIASRHNFPPPLPSPEFAAQHLAGAFSHPGMFCVVAEVDGKIVGSNCLDERNPIAGIGPITVDPTGQNRSVGRRLMQAVMDRAAQKHFSGVRLVQAAYHNRSLSLYAKLGFDVREPLSCMQGPAIGQQTPGYRVRPAAASDADACNALCRRVHGHDRSGELRDAVSEGMAVVAETRGRLAAYATGLAFFGHAVAETNEDLQALISAAPAFIGPGILVPSRNAELFRWCLDHGLRVVEPYTLMTVGLYNEPAGAFLPSITY